MGSEFVTIACFGEEKLDCIRYED
ncbi:protein of unknown function [Maridesulfovibrio hydrothermalis AM13 = DSM 14728]|uniref:Uncharacterized protein n=1 Tax=Maridesulfovibrio hydrothermalis AM13 = DSM 14728 TaxID=1121451 RepID=L0RDV3_9BACT|nr:protein of unknown function [Maridesulfovibrio hydrothermalis AM13 = DSM 14728]